RDRSLRRIRIAVARACGAVDWFKPQAVVTSRSAGVIDIEVQEGKLIATNGCGIRAIAEARQSAPWRDGPIGITQLLTSVALTGGGLEIGAAGAERRRGWTVDHLARIRA